MNVAQVNLNKRIGETLLNYHDKGIELYTKHRQKLMRVLQTVSIVALSVFSLYTDYKLFLPFFFTGVVCGIYTQWVSSRKKNAHSHHHSHDHEEGLHGIKLPPELGVIANIVLTICHIDHHTEFVVPIVGFAAGYQLGGELQKKLRKLF